jgi:hypothetical protein
MKTALLTITFAAIALTQTASADEFEILKFFESSSKYIHIITKSDKAVLAKCTVFDKANEVLSVNKVAIDKGHDEVTLSTNGPASAAHRVSCSVYSEQLW